MIYATNYPWHILWESRIHAFLQEWEMGIKHTPTTNMTASFPLFLSPKGILSLIIIDFDKFSEDTQGFIIKELCYFFFSCRIFCKNCNEIILI